MSDARGRNGSTFNNVVSQGFGLPTLSDLRNSSALSASSGSISREFSNSLAALGSLHDGDRLALSAAPHHGDAHHVSGGSILGHYAPSDASLHVSDDDLFSSDSSSAPVQNLYSGHGHDASLGGVVGGSNGVHAPPPIGTVGGQLWFGGEGVSADDGLFHIDSDAAGRDVADLTTAHVSFENVGLDSAGGFYFGISADGLLRSGHITNDQETNEASQIATVDMIFGAGVSADEVQALAVDPLNHIIFVGLWGQSDNTTSILEVQYNATTGALTSPYNASTGSITDFNHVLMHDDNTGKIGGVNFTNVIAMQYDMQNGNLYYVDQTNGTSFAGGAGATWQATNGIYVVSTAGTVGGGTAPTPTELSLNSQFAGGDNNNYIEGLAINEAQGIIYFCVNNASTSTSKLFYMPIAGGTATQITLPSSFFADNNLAGVNSISFDPNLRQLYISDNAHSKIIQVTLDAAGHVASSTNMSFMDFDSGIGGSSATGLYFDPLPTLSALTATTTEAVQGGSAITLLTAAPSISDPQDGAVNKLHMGYLQVVVANAQSGDNLFYSGAQSGTFDSGKMTISWNSSTHTLTLTGNETEAFYDTLFQNISFQDSGTDNSTGSHPTRTIDWIISDGTTVVNQTTSDSNEKATTVVIDRAPTLASDNYAVLESATATGTSGTGGTGVLGNDNDKDADAITVTAVNGSGANVGNSTTGTYGHLTLNANGSYSYIADNTAAIDAAPNGSHPVDSFTYTVSDGLGGVSTTTVTFTIDRAPTVVADNGAAVESFSGSGNVLTNDSDKDGDTLTVSAVAGSGANVGNSVAGTYGHITINANGSYTYNADNTAAIDGAATGSHLTDTFSYTANDSHGGTTTTNIIVTLDRAPTVVVDAGAAVESASGTGNVLTNDSDRDGDTLTVSAVNGNAGNVGNSVAGTYGHITINSNGSYTYNADNIAAIDAAATGSHLTDSFTYTASDGHGGTTSTTITVTLDRGPTVVADTNTAVEGASGSGNVLTNDSDRDGDTLTVSAVAGSGANVGNSVATTYGHITINANGSYTYNADNIAAIDGAATGSHLTDTISYTANDGHGGTTTTNVVITLDRAPTVVADNGAAVESFSGSGNVLTNDSDRDGDTLTVSAVAGSGANVGNSVATTYGHITINANGSYTYLADNTVAIDGAATGSHLTDTVSYTANDGHGGTTTTNIIVTLDRAPTVVTDSASLAESGSVSRNAATGVLANDSDRDGDTLVVSAVNGSGGNVGNSTAGTYGHLTLNADGSYTYNADNTGAIDGAANGSHPIDTFTITVSDGHGGTTDETLSFTIDRAATANADSVSTTENSTAQNGSGGNANLLANDVDKDGDAITITQVQGSGANVGTQIVLASGALLTVNADGSYVYDPNHAFDYLPGAASGASNTTATDTFTYTVDGGSTVTVTITINGVDSNDTLIGTAGADTLHGGIGDDTINSLGGNDTIFGDSGDDVILMNNNLTAADKIDGGTNTDHVVLNGDYTGGNAVVFNATTMVNVEFLALTAGHSYDLTMDNATVAAGQILRVQAGTLGVGDNVTFNASADTTGGDYIITTGAGDDNLTGGNGLDHFIVGSGNDTVHAGGGRDTINLGAFLTAADTIDGGTGDDTLYLSGDYHSGVTLAASTLTNVETIALAAGNIYNLTMDAATVAAGQSLTLRAGSLVGGDNVTFDASAGVVGSSYILNTGAGNDVLTGGAGDDTFRPGSGTDTVHGGGGNDVVNMAGFLTAADSIDGGSGTDSILLDGNYSAGLTFGSTTMTNVEVLQVTAGNSYNLTLDISNVTVGNTLTVKASTLGAADSFTFDGSAIASGASLVINAGIENDTLLGGQGDDVIRAGDGTNHITGGGGSDSIFGGSGVDTFIYNLASDSTSTGYDRVKGFDASMDIFQLNGIPVNAIDTAVTVGKLYTATFDTDLSAAIDGDALGAHDAVLFTPSKGDLHGHTFLIVDVNGVAGYQAGQDLVIDITGATNLGSLTTSDFTH